MTARMDYKRYIGDRTVRGLAREVCRAIATSPVDIGVAFLKSPTLAAWLRERLGETEARILLRRLMIDEAYARLECVTQTSDTLEDAPRGYERIIRDEANHWSGYRATKQDRRAVLFKTPHTQE